jgi:hypothetical protein
MTTNKRMKLIPAIARLDAKPRKQPRNQQLRQHRQAQAWRKAAGESKQSKHTERD